MDTVLLNTKLKRPPVTSDLIARQRLGARLNERAARGLTGFSAPAGYGKTTLLSAWCETQDLATCWVSLDENDNAANLFLRYIVAALKTSHPHSFAELGGLLATPQQIPTQVLVTSFVNQIDEWERRIILVLDDYHFIREGASSEFFNILIQNWGSRTAARRSKPRRNSEFSLPSRVSPSFSPKYQPNTPKLLDFGGCNFSPRVV